MAPFRSFALALALLLGMPEPVQAAAPNFSLEVVDEEGDTIAAAALLSRTEVLTVAHAVPGFGQRMSVRCGKQLIFGFVVKVDEIADLALVQLLAQCKQVGVLPLASFDVEDGTKIFLQGYPGGGPRKTTTGIVSGYEDISFENRGSASRHVMLSDATCAGGNSGGPAFANGKLIGILQAKLCINSPRGLVPACYAILAPPSLIHTFLAGK